MLSLCRAAEPFRRSELIFEPEAWHNHSSSIVELPNGDLFACWYHGSGERKADDVRVEAAHLRKGSSHWDDRFTLVDTPGFPDTNPALFIDRSLRGATGGKVVLVTGGSSGIGLAAAIKFAESGAITLICARVRTGSLTWPLAFSL